MPVWARLEKGARGKRIAHPKNEKVLVVRTVRRRKKVPVVGGLAFLSNRGYRPDERLVGSADIAHQFDFMVVIFMSESVNHFTRCFSKHGAVAQRQAIDR